MIWHDMGGRDEKNQCLKSSCDMREQNSCEYAQDVVQLTVLTVLCMYVCMYVWMTQLSAFHQVVFAGANTALERPIYNRPVHVYTVKQNLYRALLIGATCLCNIECCNSCCCLTLPVSFGLLLFSFQVLLFEKKTVHPVLCQPNSAYNTRVVCVLPILCALPWSRFKIQENFFPTF